LKLASECERVKQVLSQTQECSLQIDGLYEGRDFSANITRARFEGMVDFLFKKIVSHLDAVVVSAGGLEKINGIILAGGNCKIPKIQQYIKQYVGDKVKILSKIDPTEVNVRGAGLHGTLLLARNPLVSAHVKKHMQITSASIGIADHAGNFQVLIPKNTVLPCKVSQTFKASSPNGFVQIFEGEEKECKGNRLLGEFSFAVGESLQCKLTFMMDMTGALTATAGLKSSSQTTIFKLTTANNKKT